MAPHPPLLLPAETQNREFDAKLLLACVAAERGFPAVVGSRIHMHAAIARMPRGIYVAKDVRRPSRRIFRILRRLGHAIVAWDEEGLIFITPALYHRRRIDPDTLAMIELYLAWGETAGTLVRTAPGYRGAPVALTGNPRIDLLRPELRGFFAAEAAALRERHGRFVLVNTNFGRINHFNPNLSLRPSAEGAAALANLEADDPPLEAWRFREAVMHAMAEMVPAVARAFPGVTVIVRPHPSEGHAFWREAAAGLANVAVIHEGYVAPWLMAAEAAVHNGCTTGIEGRLLGTPVFAFRPVVSDAFEIALPNRVGIEAASTQALIEGLEGVLAAPGAREPDARERAELAPYIEALEGPLACDRIVDELAGFAARRPIRRPPAAARLRGRVEALGRATVKGLNALRPGHKDSAAFARQRFPGMDAAGVAERIARFDALLGRFADVGARELAPNVFLVERR